MTTAAALAQQRRFHHGRREAVARCPDCQRYFCRECVTEHADRLICAACLAKAGRPAGDAAAHWRVVRNAAQCLAALVMAWLFFFGLGRLLLRMPDTFHDGTLWQADLEDAP